MTQVTKKQQLASDTFQYFMRPTVSQ